MTATQIIQTDEDRRVATAVTALVEGLPRSLVEEILAGMATEDRLNVLDVVLAQRADRAQR